MTLRMAWFVSTIMPGLKAGLSTHINTHVSSTYLSIYLPGTTPGESLRYSQWHLKSGISYYCCRCRNAVSR